MRWLLEDINREFRDGEVEQAVTGIIEKSDGLKSRQWYELAFSCIDLTTLNSTDGSIQGEALARKVSRFPDHFPGLPNVAAICVYPTLIESVKKYLQPPEVKLASVAAGFPTSQTYLEVKILETEIAVAKGAGEIDVVLSLSNFFTENYAIVLHEISTIRSACKKARLKVILETGTLKSYPNIWKASFLAMEGGADFIKTSTGKMEPAATPEAAWVMCSAIKSYYEKSNKKIGFKAAGGIVEPQDALTYLAIVKAVLGNEWLNNSLFRIGSSRLANNLLSVIKGEGVTYF